jgi:hypothetical protein
MDNRFSRLALGVAGLSTAAISGTASAGTGVDFTSLTTSVDFTTATTAVLAVFAALATLYVAMKGGRLVLRAIR